MNMLNVVRRRIMWEQKSYWRNPAAAAFTFGFPLLFLVIFIAINGNERVGLAGGHVRFAQYYVPAILAFGLISACYTGLAFTLSIRRESGLLKRIRGTPLSPWAYLMGIVGNGVVVAAILSALVMALGFIAYHVTWPGRYVALLLTVGFGAFCFCALGILISTFVPNEDAAPAIINFALFPLLFISGTFGTVKDSSVIAKIARIFPVRHLNQSMVAVFNPFGGGNGINVGHLAVMAAWGAGALVLALRRFRWEPNR